ncbi:MAG: hypothetical protein ACR2NM_10760 [Bythopirellula sp.]
MNSSLLNGFLFAQISRWERLGDGLHRGRGRMDPMDFLPLVIVLVIFAIVVAVVVKLRKRNDMSQPCDDPDKLFRELSLLHELDRGSQKLLRRLAEALQLVQPAEVFLKPAYFQADGIPAELQREAAELEALGKRLF